jgi:hypothetical protein
MPAKRAAKPKVDNSSPPKEKLPAVPHFGLNITDWRRNPELVGFAKQLFADQRFQILLDVVRNSRPHEVPGTDGGCTRYLGAIEGHDYAVKVLLSLPLHPIGVSDEIPAEFGVSSNEQ